MTSAEWIDISVPLQPGITAWPGSPGVRLSRTTDIGSGDPVNNSRLDCDVHAGTHVDAPLHHFRDGGDVTTLRPEDLIGPAFVADLRHVKSVRATDLARLPLPSGTERLLLRTSNSAGWSNPTAPFRVDFVALTLDAAHWMVEKGLRLVGVDYLSVQRYSDGPETHRVLLGAAIVLLEGLDLSRVESGPYELFCLPLKLVGADGAPARAMLRRIPP